VSATDVDTDNASIAFTVSGSELSITSAGALTFASAPDYETKTSYTATVTASDGTNSTTQSITVNVTNLNDNSPVFTSGTTFNANENQTTIGTVAASDADGETLSYSISGTDASSMSVDSSSGALTFGAAPDYETKTSYSVTATATDGTNSINQSVTINVTNLNDNSPVFTSSTTFSVNENQTTVGTVAASDADGNTLSYSISGTDAPSISINASTGALTFNSAPNYEAKSSYSVTAAASDGTNSTTQNITVSVVDVNEAPAFTSSATFSANEKQTSIGTVTATDVESNTLSYSVTGTDASAITINSSTGVLTFNTGPDYETKSSYSATAAVTDGVSSVTQAITIGINETEFEVSGIAYSSKYFVMDGDIPNTDYVVNDNSNNSVSGAQSILNPTVISGYTGHAGDTHDLFVVSTSANMYVNLDVVDYSSGTKDLDVYVYNSDGSSRDFSYVSGSTEENETINLPSGGTYIIRVYPYSGASAYLLTVGQRLTSSQADSSNAEFTPNEILSYIPFTKSLSQVPQTEQLARLRSPALAERIKALKLPRSVLEYTPSLRKIGSDFLIKMFRSKLEAGLDVDLKMSDKQKIYLSHWKAMKRLKEINPMASYELNYKIKKMANFSADPLYKYQWNQKQINLEAALNAVGQEVKNIAVAVIDSGSPTVNSAAWNATEFISGGYDFVSSSSNGDGNGIDSDPTDPDASLTGGESHGSHVATTIGIKNDGSGLNGMAVKVLPLRVFPTDATGDGGSMYDLKQAVLYAAGLANDSGTVAPTTTPIKVINLSLSGGGVESCDVYADVVAQGITVVAASGNDGAEAPGGFNYPASCPNVISVGATDSLDERASYSQYNNSVDIAAPGGSYIDIDSDGYADLIYAYYNNADITGIQGTSMATPHVAGAIALLYAIDTNMSPSIVNTYLQAGYLTDDTGTSGYDTSFGYGRLNLVKAIQNTLSNIGDSTTTFFSSSAPYLNFGASSTQLNVTLSKSGSASLSVSSLTADDATGLSYGSSVDSNGAGTYTLYIDRSEIPNGAFQNRLYFNLSDSSKISLGLYYEVGVARSRANLGKVFVGLYNSSDTLIASGSLALDGTLGFVANDIVNGEYRFVVSTNNDDDGYVCDSGELCARYPGSEGAKTFTVNGADTDGAIIDLEPIFRFGGINAASMGGQASYNADIKSPTAGIVSKRITKLEGLDSDDVDDREDGKIPEDAIPINSN
jgi:serine protease